MSRNKDDEIRTTTHTITDHLASWGLRRFTSDESYFQWQRQCLEQSAVADLHRRIEEKRRGGPAEETAFYDAAANLQILPVLHSQRYDYYAVIGQRIASRLGEASTVLDFGCGVGILTTYYAKLFPEKSFLGVDRSSRSIERARKWVKDMGFGNVRFECADATPEAHIGEHECIVATHVLFQAEQDPGLPSRDWTTFERDDNAFQQRLFEERTGIGLRLDGLAVALASHGRMIVFEKTRQLARRVPFQRALAARRLTLSERPEPVCYRLVEETVEDGPLFVLEKDGHGTFVWDETPEPDEGRSLEVPSAAAHAIGDEPLYENHHPSAQTAWGKLHGRSTIKETTMQEPDGRQMHVELGRANEGVYLYCANTFDQRQLVIVDPVHSAMIESYYREIIGGMY
ncbi:class I SAM-dependent methyltransferase [Petrachloros mirabilis]